ncbi:MAG: ImmA/IrrE family metallo-endopeptidase, partial [Planctomycetota bacterium]
IIYNNALNRGRINFTLGHEFGHYLMHRVAYPNGFKCSVEDMASWESEYGQREHEANIFASTLLMPLDDFRAQVEDKKQPCLDEMGHCANRYEVSLIAAILKWLQYTTRRTVLVVSRDGFILWARSSKAALKTRLYYKIRNRDPIEIPNNSLAANITELNSSAGSRELDESAWLSNPCTEHVIVSDQYEFTISLLHFGDAERNFEILEEPVEDVVDRMTTTKFSRH